MKKRYIVKIESYNGDESHIDCGIDEQDFLYAIIVVGKTGAIIIDSGYRSVEEALKYWPEATPCSS